MKTLLLPIIILLSLSLNAQTTLSGKPIKFVAVNGVDITVAPLDKDLKDPLYGWIQSGVTIYPVYQGKEGGLYMSRVSKSGNKYKSYIPLERRDKITKE